MEQSPVWTLLRFFAVCCAQNRIAAGKPIPHLRPEMYFVFRFCGKFCEAFFSFFQQMGSLEAEGCFSS